MALKKSSFNNWYIVRGMFSNKYVACVIWEFKHFIDYLQYKQYAKFWGFELYIGLIPLFFPFPFST